MWPFRRRAAETPEPQPRDPELDQRRRAFEFAAINLEEQSRHQSLRAEAMETDNRRLSLLFQIVQRMNDIQDEDERTVEHELGTKTVRRKTRPLNPHEEDVYNASLIQMKELLDFS